MVPACAFNNTSALPLLILQSLEGVGSLELIVPDGESVSVAISRAQSYFLVFAVVTKTVSYVIGPKMLNDGAGDDSEGRNQDIASLGHSEADGFQDGPDERTLLLPQNITETGASKPHRRLLGRWRRLFSYVVPDPVRSELMAPFESGFADVAILCAVTGVVLGLVPQLHRAFFCSPEDGGFFNAWLTSSIQNIGKLFTSFQVFIVGCKLGLSFEKMKSSESRSGSLPVTAVVTIFVIRLIVWPA